MTLSDFNARNAATTSREIKADRTYGRALLGLLAFVGLALVPLVIAVTSIPAQVFTLALSGQDLRLSFGGLFGLGLIAILVVVVFRIILEAIASLRSARELASSLVR